MAHGAQLILLTHMGCQPGMASQMQPDWSSLQSAAGLGQPAAGLGSLQTQGTSSLQSQGSQQPADRPLDLCGLLLLFFC